MQPQPGVGRIQPADDPIQAEHLGVGDERQPDIVLCGLRLQAPVPLHQLDHVPPVDLHDVVHISPGHPQADQHLDDKLIPRRRDVAGRGAKPAVQLGTPGRGDRKPLLRPRLALVVGLHQPVALEALQGDVHLPHIQRPHLAGPLLELLLQPQAVLRPLAEQGQQGMPDAHRPSQTLIITISILVILRTTSRRSPAGDHATPCGQQGQTGACPPEGRYGLRASDSPIAAVPRWGSWALSGAVTLRG